MDLLIGSHTGANLATSFITVLEEFQLVNKVLAITTDNASNCDAMFLKLSEIFVEKNITFLMFNQRVRCLAHIVNLACQDALSVLKRVSVIMEDESDIYSDDDGSELDESTEKANEEHTSIFDRISHFLVTTFIDIFILHVQIKPLLFYIRKGVIKISKSSTFRENFQKQCSASGIKCKELIVDVRTRWNSTYFMLKRVLDMRCPFENVLRQIKTLKNCLLIDEEWEVVTEIVNFLKPFKRMSAFLSHKKIPTMSLCVMVYMELYNHLEQYSVENAQLPIIVEAANKACLKLNKYYPTSNGLVFVVGTILDPLAWYACNSAHFSAGTVNHYKGLIRTCWEKSYKPCTSFTQTPVQLCVKRSEKTPDLFSSQMKKAKLDMRDELDIYLDEKQIPADDDCIKDGPLQWWKADYELKLVEIEIRPAEADNRRAELSNQKEKKMNEFKLRTQEQKERSAMTLAIFELLKKKSV